jgi:hypothetical protein
MKFTKKIVLIISVIVLIIIIDSIQAKVFNNCPLFHIRVYYNNTSNTEFVDYGILVYHYKYKNGKSRTIFGWECILY